MLPHTLHSQRSNTIIIGSLSEQRSGLFLFNSFSQVTRFGPVLTKIEFPIDSDSCSKNLNYAVCLHDSLSFSLASEFISQTLKYTLCQFLYIERFEYNFQFLEF